MTVDVESLEPRGFALNALSFAGAAFVRQVSFAIVTVVVLAKLGEAAVGELALHFAFLMVLVGVSDLGLRQLAWKSLPDVGDPSHGALVSRYFGARLVSGAAACLLYLVGPLFLEDISTSNPIYWLYMPGLIFNAVSFDFIFLAAGRELVSNAIVGASFAVFAVFASVSLAFGAPIWAVPAAFSGALIFGSVVGVSVFSLKICRIGLPSFDGIFSMLQEALPLGFSRVLERGINNGPVLAVSLAGFSLAELGKFRLVEMVYSLCATFGIHLASAAFRRKSLNSEGVQRREITLLIAAAAALGFGALAAVGLGRAVFDRLSVLDWALLCLFVVALLAAVPVRYIRTVLPAIDHSSRLLAFNVVHILSLLALTFALSKSVGFYGSGIGVIAAELLTLGVGLTYLWKREVEDAVRV